MTKKTCPTNVRLVQHPKLNQGTSLVVHWLRLHATNAGGSGLIPGQGTRSYRPQLRFGAAKQIN